MSDFPPGPLLSDPRTTNAISVFSPWGLGGFGSAAPASIAWPAANLALFSPFRVPTPVTVYKMACGTGALTAGNFDLGIYDTAGNRLMSTGSTAKTTASSERVVDTTDLFLLPGMYYLAMAVDTLSAAYIGYTAANLGIVKQNGCREMATAFALPSTATFATSSSTLFPCIAAYLRSE